MTKKKLLSFVVTGKTENVGYVVNALEKFCHEHKLDKKLIETLLVAIDEAITNVILHAYGGQSNKTIQIDFMVDENEFIIKLIDFGKTFQPEKEKYPIQIDQLKVGGYGLVIMNEFMDELKFTHDQGKKANCLSMKKYL